MENKNLIWIGCLTAGAIFYVKFDPVFLLQ
jgi:hypothetical protein